MEITIPTIDSNVLQEKTNEFAMQGAIETLKQYYTGYNSPFRKKIEETLEEQEIPGSFGLPDVLSLINQALSKELDVFVNTAVAQTYIPMMTKLLTRAEKRMTLSAVLKEIIEISHNKDQDEYHWSMEEDPRYGWFDCELQVEKQKYRMTLHKAYIPGTAKKQDKVGCFYSLPHTSSIDRAQTMQISQGDVVLVLPFTPHIMEDRVLAFFARLVLAHTEIELDCDEFEDDMFYSECHCE